MPEGTVYFKWPRTRICFGRDTNQNTASELYSYHAPTFRSDVKRDIYRLANPFRKKHQKRSINFVADQEFERWNEENGSVMNDKISSNSRFYYAMGDKGTSPSEDGSWSRLKRVFTPLIRRNSVSPNDPFHSGQSSVNSSSAEFQHWTKLYSDNQSKIGPLRISDPALLIPQSILPILTSLPKKVGPLSDEEYSFYQNFDGLWRSDRKQIEGFTPIFDEAQIDERTREKYESYRNLRLRVSASRIKGYIEPGVGSQINEYRPWSGDKTKAPRRDHRPGEADCWVERYQQGLVFKTQWSEPNAALATEFMELTSDYMHLCTTIVFSAQDGVDLHAKIIWHRLLR